MNFGAFAGGMAQGITQGVKNNAEQEDAAWKEKERARQQKEWDRQDAIREQIKALPLPQTAYIERNKQLQEANSDAGAMASAGRVTQEAFNPVANGVMLTPGAEQPATTFTADVQQRQASNPVLSGIASPATDTPPSAGQTPATTMQVPDQAQVVSDAINKQLPMKQPAQIPLEVSPRLADYLDYKQQVLGIKQAAGVDVSQDMMELKAMSDKLTKEGARDALALLATGDIQNTLHELNNNGDHRGWKQDGPPQMGVDVVVGGVPMKTNILNIVDEQGNKRQLNSAVDMYSLMSAEKKYEGAQKNEEIGVQKKRAETEATTATNNAAYQAGMLGVANTNAESEKALREQQTKTAKMTNEHAQKLIDKFAEYQSAKTPEEQKKRLEEYQVLSGKDNDNYMPVMGKDEVTGMPIFAGTLNKKTNEFTPVSALKSGGSQPTTPFNPAQFPIGGAKSESQPAAPASITSQPTGTQQTAQPSAVQQAVLTGTRNVPNVPRASGHMTNAQAQLAQAQATVRNPVASRAERAAAQAIIDANSPILMMDK